jgi:hypothetical protein
MPFIDSGNSVFSKYPSDLQVRFKGAGGKYVWVPFVGETFDVTKEMIAEHYAGTGLPVNITEGNTDFKGTLETGWVTKGIPQDWLDEGYMVADAQFWEYLLNTYLIYPSDQGRSVPFVIEFHEREYTNVDAQGNPSGVVGGNIWAMFGGCKLNRHAHSATQGSVAKRTYEWIGKFARFGNWPTIMV